MNTPKTIDEEYQMAITIFLFIIILIGYILLWIIANKRTQVNLSIKNPEIEIKIGDIFESEGLKVIAFNEYFDTIVDNKVISEKSLNGQFINAKSFEI